MKFKKGIWTAAILLAGIFLETGTVFAEAGVKNLEGNQMPTGDLAEYTPSKPMELLSGQDAAKLDEIMSTYNGSGSSLLKNTSKSYYYYENLDPVAKEIYDVMLGVAQDPVSEGNIGLMMTDIDPQSQDYYYEFNIAYRALCFDHPELFWLYSGQEAEMVYLSEAVNYGGFYFVYIKIAEPFVNYEKQMQAFNTAAEAFLADVNRNASDYEIVRQIHDKLIALVNYNDPVADGAVALERGQDLAHTAYGCLVTDSSGISNYAVCDGYTLAMEYLLQQCGIEAAFIGGMAGASEAEAGGHAWNIVKIDGVWYEMDSTWDDAGSREDDLTPGTEEYQYFMEALQDPGYREKLDHFLFLVSTDTITHFLPGDEYKYITQDGMYEIQMVQESVHIRLNNSSRGSECDSAIISLAPDAMQSYQ